MDRLNRAIYDTAHDFDGGVPAMAQRLATKAGTLNNKVDPCMDGHRLNVYEALAMMLTARDYRILFALANDCGFACYQVGDWSDCSDMELLERITELGAERGRVDEAIHDALADRVIERREYDRIHDRVRAAIRANLELLTRLEALSVAEERHALGLHVCGRIS